MIGSVVLAVLLGLALIGCVFLAIGWMRANDQIDDMHDDMEALTETVADMSVDRAIALSALDQIVAMETENMAHIGKRMVAVARSVLP